VNLNEDDWQVIHLSTGHEGGAGLAARRLNSALNQQGIKSRFGALKNPNYVLAVNEFSISRKLWQRVISGIIVRIQRLLTRKVLFSLISLNVYTFKQIRNLGNPTNTILHFHNWYNLVSQKEIIKLNKKGYPVVLTLHDERFFTGGCHYAFTCQKFKNGCEVCPELVSAINHVPGNNVSSSLNHLKKSNAGLVFIAPSQWIKSEAQSSILLKNKRVIFIPNTLGVSAGGSENKIKEPGDSPSVLKVGVASMDKSSYIKGGDITSEVEMALSTNNMGVEIVYLSDLKNKTNAKFEFWDQIDYLLVPSRAENSPNVIHEAKQFGIPVIASDIGGISELLFSGFDIALPESEISARKILEVFSELRIHRRLRDTEDMQKSFSNYVSGSIESHKKLYLSLLSRK
jgi:glycosyltransferase involved in cell wall biosynthesis